MASASGGFSGRSQYSLVLTVNQNSQDIGGNYSNLGVDLRINESPNNGSYSLSNPLYWSWNVDGQTASGSTTYDFRSYDVLVLWSGGISVGHNADGTKSVGFSAGTSGTSVIGNASCSGSMGLTTIPRASYPTADGDNIFEAGQTITINSNRASSGFTHTMEYYFGSASGTIGTGIGASTTWAVPLTLLNQIPNSAAGTGIIRTYTYNGGTHIGTTDVGITIGAPSTVVPDFTTVTHSEATAGVAANVGAYVQNISSLALAITGAAGIYGSTIASYKIEVLDSGSNVVQTVNAVSGTTTAVNASGTVTLRGTITDTRGRVKVKTVTTSFLAYAPPLFVTPTTARRALVGGTVDEDDGTYIRVDINAAVQSLMNTTQRNAINYRISTRTRGTTTWTVKATTTPGGITFNSFATITGPYALTTAYEVFVEVYDDFTTTGIILQVPVAAIFMHWDAALGVGIGKFRENGMLDVAGMIYSKGLGLIETTDWNTALASGYYYSDTGATNAPYADRWHGEVFAMGGSLAGRIRQELSVPTTGDAGRLKWYRIYSGSAWGPWKRSDKIMIPTSCIGGTAAAPVNVMATAFDMATGRYNLRPGDKYFGMDGVFTTEFRTYELYIEWGTAAVNGAGVRFRMAGAEVAPASGYEFQIMYVTGTGTPGAQRSASNQGNFPPNSAQGFAATIHISNPMHTAGTWKQKRMMGQWHSYAPEQAATVNTNLVGYDTSALDGIGVYNSDQGLAGVFAQSESFMYVRGIA